MPRPICWTPSLVLLAFLLSLPPVAAGDESVELNGQTFTLPDGFQIEVAAKSPLVDRPITASFDEQGRLYVADSSGSNDKVEKQLAEKPHRIVRLEDRDGDGQFDHSTVFADKMMFPEGTLWFDGSLYVSAPPSIWKLTDTDGDGVADERVEWFQGKTLTGCANDLHGPYLGRDGWIYWCKGAFAEQTYERPGRPPLVTKASHIFRARPDGSQIEPVMTGGMDNPVDVVFTPEGERIFSCTFLQHPAGGNRDGLIHALYGGVYGKVHHVIDGHPRTSPDVLPPLAHLGPAAPAGLHYYDATAFGPDYERTIFTALFNLQRVTRHKLVADGGTFRTEDVDFVVSDNRDFHPTDVLEDADGSLLVVDTGGWYKLCCPTSQLVKPDVLGTIYRVRRVDASRVDDPRGLKIDWANSRPSQLIELLADSRPAVRERATQTLAKVGKKAVGPLRTALAVSESPAQRREVVWALTRIDHPDARLAVQAALRDPEDSVCHAAAHSAGLWRDANALPLLVEASKRKSVAVRRAAAEALGRLGNKRSVPALFEMLERASSEQLNDIALEHSVTYALIEIAAPNETTKGLTSSSFSVRRAALVALDQMDGDHLQPASVADELIAANNPLRPTARWILSRHPMWGDILTPTFARQLQRGQLSDTERAELEQQLAELADAPKIQALLAERLNDKTASDSERISVLKAMSGARLKQIPEAWVTGIESSLAADDQSLVTWAATATSRLPLTDEQLKTLEPALVALSTDVRHKTETRLRALSLVKGGALSDETFEVVRGHLAFDSNAEQRALAITVLRRAKLTRDQADSIAAKLGGYYLSAADAETLLLIAATYPDAAMRERVMTGLRHGAYVRGMTPEVVARNLKPFGEEFVNRAVHAVKMAKVLDADAGKRLEEKLAALPEGDIRRGQAVFNSAKANCASCHSIGYLGGKVGPDLTKIGSIRTKRDLIESILYPSASFVRSYEPYLVLTTDGQSASGILRKDAADEVILAKDAKTEIRIPREQVEEMRIGSVSIMPDRLDEQLSQQDLADLLEFLQACK